jgi:hypothetical protein
MQTRNKWRLSARLKKNIKRKPESKERAIGKFKLIIR